MKKNTKNKVSSLKLGKEAFKNSICCLGEQFSMILDNIINDTIVQECLSLLQKK